MSLARGRARALAAAGALALAACGGTSADPAAVDVDGDVVDLLADLHLADARAALAPATTRRAVLADSLRGVALAAHGWTPDRWEALQRRWAAAPAEAVAHYDTLDARLRADLYAAP